jgi:hypothetical protein
LPGRWSEPSTKFFRIGRRPDPAEEILMGCDFCVNAWPVYSRLTELAKDFERHALLLRCPQCGTLYEIFPEERGVPQAITEDEARQRFPGAT